MKELKEIFNPFPTNVSLTEKPSSSFLLAKCTKTLVEESHFASKHQLLGFRIGGTLVKNGLRKIHTPLFRYNSFVQNI